MSDRPHRALQEARPRRFGAGVVVVMRRRLRGRSLRRELVWQALTLGLVLGLARWLQGAWPQRNTAGDVRAALLARWLTTSLLGATPILLAIAVVLGAGATPALEEAGEVQEALLTRLRPVEIVTGRLLAALWPILTAVMLSCGLWTLVVSLVRSDKEIGIGAVAAAHGALGCAVLMFGALAALFAFQRRPGRARGRGTAMALVCAAGCTTAVLLIDPQIRRMDDPVRLIEGALLISPIAAVTTPLRLDLLRTQWLYGHTTAPEFEFAYPPSLLSSMLFLGVSGAAIGGGARRLRRAYQG